MKKILQWLKGIFVENTLPESSRQPTIVPREILSVDLRFDNIESNEIIKE